MARASDLTRGYLFSLSTWNIFSFLDVRYSIKSICRLVTCIPGEIAGKVSMWRTELSAVTQYAHSVRGVVTTPENLWQEEGIEMCMFTVRSWPHCLSRIWRICNVKTKLTSILRGIESALFPCMDLSLTEHHLENEI